MNEIEMIAKSVDLAHKYYQPKYFKHAVAVYKALESKGAYTQAIGLCHDLLDGSRDLSHITFDGRHCTEEEVDTFVAKYGSAKTCKDFIERCERIIKINPELRTVIESKIPAITKDTHYSVDEFNTRIRLFCKSILAYNNTMNLKDFLERTRSIINELDK